MELFKPRGASAPRRPTDNNQRNGQVINTVNGYEIDLRNIPSGMYFLRVNKVKTKKLIIKK